MHASPPDTPAPPDRRDRRPAPGAGADPTRSRTVTGCRGLVVRSAGGDCVSTWPWYCLPVPGSRSRAAIRNQGEPHSHRRPRVGPGGSAGTAADLRPQSWPAGRGRGDVNRRPRHELARPCGSGTPPEPSLRAVLARQRDGHTPRACRGGRHWTMRRPCTCWTERPAKPTRRHAPTVHGRGCQKTLRQGVDRRAAAEVAWRVARHRDTASSVCVAGTPVWARQVEPRAYLVRMPDRGEAGSSLAVHAVLLPAWPGGGSLSA